ncbi:MAG: 30S ribosome-binding factor RbfA [Spirochaetes bacterium]|nr:30S ribosome-binding factor RbfA [Spirochaetota bacterium]
MGYRKERLEEQIKRTVSELLIREIKDPRIGFATVTGVELSKDYSEAKIGISVLGDPRDVRKSIEGLRSATPYIQHRLGKSMSLRITPRISFFLDTSVAEGVRMVEMIDGLEYSGENGGEGETGSGPDEE